MGALALRSGAQHSRIVVTAPSRLVSVLAQFNSTPGPTTLESVTRLSMASAVHLLGATTPPRATKVFTPTQPGATTRLPVIRRSTATQVEAPIPPAVIRR